MKTHVFRTLALTLTLGALLPVPSAMAQQETICETLSACLVLRTQVETRLRELQPIPSLDPIVRKTARSGKYCPLVQDGEICEMSHRNAKKYCSDIGSRLPTARELALAYNATGISLTPLNTVTSHPIFTEIAPGETVIDFYYDRASYVRPPEVDGGYAIWSSTIQPDDPALAYLFSRHNGYIYYHYIRDIDKVAVRCVMPR